MTGLSPEERRRVYEEEKARIEGKRSPGKRPFKVILISAIAAVVLIVGGGVLGSRQYRVHILKQKLGEAIGRDLGLTDTILRIESESSKITYGELFELCDKSVQNRTDLIVELRGLYPELDYQLKTRLIDYLNAENEFVRAKRAFYRKSMEFSSAADSYSEQVKDLPSSEYGWDFYRSRVRQLKAKALESAREAELSADDFLKTYEKVTGEEAAISQEARNAGLRFDPIFQKHAKGNQGKARDTKEGAQQLAKMFEAEGR